MVLVNPKYGTQFLTPFLLTLNQLPAKLNNCMVHCLLNGYDLAHP
jgi:hypothetical protein